MPDTMQPDNHSLQTANAPNTKSEQDTFSWRKLTTPDTATLVYLAAQARFANLAPDEAVIAADKLWREADRSVRCQEALDLIDEWKCKEESAIQQPKHWPATLDDFYRLIVYARDKTENQPRFKLYRLHYWRKVLANIKHPPMTEQEELDWSEFDLKRFKRDGFPTEEKWTQEAKEYRRWWMRENTESKRRAGKARAAKAAAKLKPARRRKNAS